MCLISCCHFSSCSLVNHLSRSPLCNQLNLVIKWRNLKNAAQHGFRPLQKKHKPETKENSVDGLDVPAIEFKPVWVALKLMS